MSALCTVHKQLLQACAKLVEELEDSGLPKIKWPEQEDKVTGPDLFTPETSDQWWLMKAHSIKWQIGSNVYCVHFLQNDQLIQMSTECVCYWMTNSLKCSLSAIPEYGMTNLLNFPQLRALLNDKSSEMSNKSCDGQGCRDAPLIDEQAKITPPLWDRGTLNETTWESIKLNISR